jgi:hypothetical protein
MPPMELVAHLIETNGTISSKARIDSLGRLAAPYGTPTRPWRQYSVLRNEVRTQYFYYSVLARERAK